MTKAKKTRRSTVVEEISSDRVFVKPPYLWKVRDRAGEKVGHLTVLSYLGISEKYAWWKCKCVCGRVVQLKGRSLTERASPHCGCRGGKPRRIDIPEFFVWAWMIQRCTNPNNKRYDCYGGRGIKVCKRWLSFDSFYADMGKKPTSGHSLERKDVNGDYCKQNCIWVTHQEQAYNKRNTVYVSYKGERISAAKLAKETGVARERIIWNHKKGRVDDELFWRRSKVGGRHRGKRAKG